eukprot:7253145-Prymnesium_polylepis.2
MSSAASVRTIRFGRLSKKEMKKVKYTCGSRPPPSWPTLPGQAHKPSTTSRCSEDTGAPGVSEMDRLRWSERARVRNSGTPSHFGSVRKYCSLL